MWSRTLPSPSLVAITTLLTTYISLVTAHTIITYPGYRGNNLIKNGTTLESEGLGEGPNNTFPYGMQWMYPCESLLPECQVNAKNLSLTITSRWWNANFNEPDPLAHQRWCHCHSTWLGFRPLDRFLLHQHGLRHRPAQYVISHGSSFADRRTI